jgi:hypothetical protein|tara:strand:- start:11009 stop:11665 length:657 start_codon:yes stop_codon:yes gene_type:complete
MKKILFLAILLIMISSVFGADLYYKKGDTIDLKVPCINNGSACSGTAECNVTVTYPNGTNFVNNQLMTNGGTYHNYTLSDTSVSGEYQTTVFCNDSAVTGYSTYNFEINNIGVAKNDMQLMGVYVVIIAMVAAYLFSAFKLDNQHIVNKIVLFLMGLINLIMGLLIAYIDLISGFDTADMVLYLFEGNIFVLFIVISMFMINTLKKAKQIDMEKEENL